MGLDCKEIPEVGMRLLDSQGFNCPKYSDEYLYNMLCLNLLNPGKNVKLREEGIAAIVIPIMIPRGGRIEFTKINILYRIIMLF